MNILDPKNNVEKIEKKKKDMNYLAEQVVKEKSESKRREYEKLLESETLGTRKYYNNPLMLLPYMIGDNERKIKEANEQLLLTNSEEKSEQVRLAIPVFDAEKGLDYKAVEENTEDSSTDGTKGTSDESNKSDSVKLIEDKINICYDHEAKKDAILKVNNMRDAVLQVFTPSNAKAIVYTKESMDKLVAETDNLRSQYATYMQDFSKLANSLIEIVMGVKTFFEQYGSIDGKMKPALFVSNCSVSSMDYARWEPFFEYTNNTPSNLDNAIWYAMIPNVSLSSMENGDEDDQEDIFGHGSDNTESHDIGVLVMNLKKCLSFLKQYEVQTFFSYEGNKKSTFSYIMKNGTRELVEAAKSLVGEDYDDIAIACYPNFTVISEQIAETCGLFNAVYVNACFAACGLVCAYQSPEYLALKKFTVDDKKVIPSVRFDIESNAPSVPSVLSVEVKGYTLGVKREILETSHGFQFCSEGSKYATVLVARSLHLEDDSDVYEPIYKRTTATYIERLLEYTFANRNGYTKEDVEAMYGEDSKSYWRRFENYDNCIIGRKDSINVKTDDTGVNIELNLANVVKKVSLNVKKI